MMWAFARLKYSPDTALLQSCEAHATDTARVLKPQELVRRCCFACEKQNLPHS